MGYPLYTLKIEIALIILFIIISQYLSDLPQHLLYLGGQPILLDAVCLDLCP